MVRSLAALGASFFSLCGSLHAQETRLDDIIKRGSLRVGTTGDYLPFTSLDKTTKTYRGFDIDMAEALGKALGVKVDFVPTTWPNLTKDLEAVIVNPGGTNESFARANIKNAPIDRSPQSLCDV
jgi:cyclohexadienyl dehydratase